LEGRAGDVARAARSGGASVFYRHETAFALAAVAAVWAAAALQWIAFDLVVPWDSKNQFYAFFRFMARAIHDGALPFWNPYHYGGHPSLADPQSLVLSPAFVLWALFDPAPSLRAFDTIVFAHLLAGGLSVALYGRRHGWPAAACVLAAAVFMLGGPAAGRAQHVGAILSYATFPVALLLLEIALDRRSLDLRSLAAALGCAVATALMVLGRNQVAMLLAVLLAAFALRRVAVAHDPMRYLRSRAAAFAVMALATFAIAAVPLLLTAQFAQLSNRHDIPLDAALMSSLYPANFANLLVANVFGALEPHDAGHWGPGPSTRPGLDATDSSFNYLFAGSLTALLLLWHGIAGGRAFAPGRRLLAAAAGVAVLYAIGRTTPAFALMFEYVPGVAVFRRPVDATFVLMAAVALLSGHIAADYMRDGLPRAPRWALALSVAAAAGLLAWAAVFSGISGKAGAAALEIAKALPVYAALVAALALARSARARAIVASLAVAFTAGELALRNAGSELNAEARWYYGVLERPTGEDLRIVETLARAIASERHGAVRPRIEIVGLGGPWQNAAMVHGFEATNGYNPLRIGAYDLLVAPGESPWTAEHRLFPRSFPRYGCTLSRLLGLEFVVLDRPMERMPHQTAHGDAELLMAGPKAWIYKLRGVAPRATLSRTVRVADAEGFVATAQFPDIQSDAEVWIDDDQTLAQSYAAALRDAPGRAEIVRYAPDRIEIAVETASPAILTLHEAWYPGWEVEVNGVRQPLLRADVLFRAVEIPAGTHRVTFAFRPLSAANLVGAVRSLAMPRPHWSLASADWPGL
jgi:hypothetical protein